MNRYQLLVFIHFFTLSFSGLYSQSLNAEFGYNENYNQSPTAIFANGDFTYISIIETASGSSFYSPNYLVKIDANGSVIWKTPINFQTIPNEVPKIEQIISASGDGVYLLVSGSRFCDVSGGCFFSIMKISEDGNIEWSYEVLNNSFDCLFSGLSLDSNAEINFNYSTDSESHIYTLSQNGSLVDSMTVAQDSLMGLVSTSLNDVLGFVSDSVFAFDEIGNIENSIKLNSPVRNQQVFGDTLFILTENSLILRNASLDSVAEYSFFPFENFLDIKRFDSLFTIKSVTVDKLYLLHLSSDFEIFGIDSFPIENNIQSIYDDPNIYVDFSRTHVSIVQKFELSEFNSVRFRDYAKR